MIRLCYSEVSVKVSRPRVIYQVVSFLSATIKRMLPATFRVACENRAQSSANQGADQVTVLLFGGCHEVSIRTVFKEGASSRLASNPVT